MKALHVVSILMVLATSEGVAQDTKRPKTPSDMIVKEQMEGKTFRNAFEIVESIRSNWLRKREVGPSVGVGSVVGGEKRDDGTNARTGSTRESPGPGSPAPQFMRESSRAGAGFYDGIQVYLDDSRMGGIDELRKIPASQVAWIKHYNGTDAQGRFGIGHQSGVIYVSTRPDR